jgi:hypothetical protein
MVQHGANPRCHKYHVKSCSNSTQSLCQHSVETFASLKSCMQLLLGLLTSSFPKGKVISGNFHSAQGLSIKQTLTCRSTSVKIRTINNTRPLRFQCAKIPLGCQVSHGTSVGAWG